MGELIAGALKLLNGIVAWFGKLIGGAGEWLKKDHDWWKIGCFVLAAGCAVAAFVAYDRKQQIVVIEMAAHTAADKCTADMNTLLSKTSGYADALTVISDSMDANTAALKSLMDRNAALEAENDRLQEKANRTFADFMAEYAKKPSVCTSALVALEQACPTLKGY